MGRTRSAQRGCANSAGIGMAFPDYFEKNLQSAALLLQGIDAEGFKKTLEREVVAVATDDEALASKEGRATLDLSVRLLARLYPTLAFVTLGKAKSKDLESHRALARVVNSKIDFETTLSNVTHYLVIGSTKLRLPKGKRAVVIYAGSDNWLARVSTKGPVGSGSSDNPFGAGAAACVAVANIFRSSFKAQLPDAKPDVEVTFSVLLMAPVDPAKPLNPALKRFDIGEVYLAGVGAIGNGFVWAMGRVDCVGTLHLVDGEVLAQSNLQRYAMTVETDVNKAKVDLAKAWFSESGLQVEPHAKHWEQFVDERQIRSFDQVAVAVDTARTRINVQASLPRIVFNSWTQTGEAGISRHEFRGPGACLACLYIPDSEVPHYDQLITRALHLPETREQLLEIRKRLRLVEPTDRGFLDRVAAAAGVPIEELLPFENKPLESLYLQGICGGAVMTLAKGGNPAQRNEVPMAFQSAFAGILLAADLVAERRALRRRLATKTQINLMTALAPFPSNGQAKAKHCFCTDADFIAAYDAKYARSETAAAMKHKKGPPLKKKSGHSS